MTKLTGFLKKPLPSIFDAPATRKEVATSLEHKSAFVTQAQGILGISDARRRVAEARQHTPAPTTMSMPAAQQPVPTVQTDTVQPVGLPLKIIYVKDELD